MWLLFLASPISVTGYLITRVAAQATGAPSSWGEILAPLGAAAPFAALAVWVIRRQERTIDYLSGELQRVNERQVTANDQATALHREQAHTMERMLNELRERRQP